MITNLIVCTSFKTSYNVLSHSHICRGGGSLNFQGDGGGEKESLSPDFRSPEVGISATDLQLIQRLYTVALQAVHRRPKQKDSVPMQISLEHFQVN